MPIATLPYAPLEEDPTSSTTESVLKLGGSSQKPGGGSQSGSDAVGLREELADLKVKLAKLEAQQTGHLVKAWEHLAAAAQAAVQNAVQSSANCCYDCGDAMRGRMEACCSMFSPRKLNSSPRKKSTADPQTQSRLANAQKGPLLINEDEWEQHKHRGLLFPSAPLKWKWDVLVFGMIIYSCIVVPWRIGMNHPPEGPWWYFEFSITIFFIADVVANFFTAYREGDQYVVSKPMIRDNYVRGWFIIDLPSSFPTELVTMAVDALVAYGVIASAGSDDANSSSSTLKVLRALRLVRLLRLLRLLKVQQHIDALEDELQISLQSLQLVKVVFGLLYITHILGCFWFWTASMSPESSWLTSYDDGSGLEADVWTQYLYSVYFTFTTLTTVGYGDVTPTNNDERIYALLCQLIGAFVFGYILSTVAELVSNVDPNAVKIEEKLSEVRVYLRWHKFPSDLTSRVKRYYEFYFSRKSAMDEDAILAGLAPSLRREVLTHLLNKSVGKFPVFKELHNDLRLEVQPMLKPVVREAKETIFLKNTPGISLYFLSRGRICGKGDMGFEFFEASAVGVAFGEHAFMRRKSLYTCAAKTRCELFIIGLNDLHALTSKLDSSQLDAMAEVLYNDYTLRFRRTTMMMRFRHNSIMKRAEGAIGEDRVRQMEACEALRLQTRWAQRRAKAASDTTSKYDVLLPRLYARRWVEPELDFAVAKDADAARLEEARRVSPRATTPRGTGAVGAGQRLQQLDAMGVPYSTPPSVPALPALPALSSAGSSSSSALAPGMAPAANSSRGWVLSGRGGGVPGPAAATPSSRQNAAAEEPPRVANAILGPAGAAQLQQLLGEQLAAHEVAMRKMVQELLRAELETRGLTRLAATETDPMLKA